MQTTYRSSVLQKNSLPLCILVFCLVNFIILHSIQQEGDDNKHTNGLLIDESFQVSSPKSLPYQRRTKSHTINNSTHNTTATEYKDHDIPQEGFAACLLIKNDNERLAEWLAYHWLTLPLKYLTVAVDPTGTTSPQHILHLWNTTNMGIEIELWNDDTYNHWVNEELDEKHKHRDRQKRFLAECQSYHKRKGRTWLAVVDPDEYITYNIINDDDPGRKKSEVVPEKFKKESYIQEMMKIRKEMGRKNFHEQYPTLFSYIEENQDKEPWISESCHLMPRLFFSSIESSKDVIAKSHAERYDFNPLDFSTLRYFHHARRGGFSYNHYGKVIVDMSRIKNREIVRNMYSIHRPNHKSCLPPTKPYYQGILRVHHYLGSWDQYSSRADIRRSRERFNKFAWVDHGVDYQLQFWLEKFVEKVGLAKAHLLLESAGKIEKGSVRLMDREDYTYSQPEIDTLPGEKEELTYFFDEDGSIIHTE